MKGERTLNTLLGGGPLHKLVKLGTLVIPVLVALIWDWTLETSFLFPAFLGGFLGMSAMIYSNIVRARKSH